MASGIDELEVLVDGLQDTAFSENGLGHLETPQVAVIEGPKMAQESRQSIALQAQRRWALGELSAVCIVCLSGPNQLMPLLAR